MIPALLVILAVAVVYAQSLGGPFLWDDRFLIPGVGLVERAGTLDDYLRSPFWAGANPEGTVRSYYRPLVTLSFALDHAVHGDNAAGYHLTNALLHVANALLLLLLLRKVGVRPWVAALFSVGWALLPRLAEAAAWISGRTELLAAAFTLAALWCWSGSLTRRVAASGLLGLGLLAKESAAAGALAILLGEWLASSGEATRARLARTARALAPLGVVLAAYLFLRSRAVGFEVTGQRLGLVGRPLAFLDACGTYGLMLLDAWRPRAIIGHPALFTRTGAALGLLVLALTVWLLLRARGRFTRAQVLGLGLTFGALFPVLHLVPIPLRTLAADRFLYLPTAGLVVAFAPTLDGLLARRREAWAFGLTLVLSLGFVTFRRIGQWSDEIGFWVTTYLETPRTNNAAATNMGNVYYQVGMYEDALTLFDCAVAYDDPNRSTARYNRGLALSRLGRDAEAARALSKSAASERPDAEKLFHLALLDLRAGRADAARARLEQAARAGNEGARWLLPRLPDIESARAEVAGLGSRAKPEQRARLASLLGEDGVAVHDWARALLEPTTTEPVAREALGAILQSGGRDLLLGAAQRYQARFGALDARLATSIEVRLDDLQHLIDARAALGLESLVAPPAQSLVRAPGRTE